MKTSVRGEFVKKTQKPSHVRTFMLISPCLTVLCRYQRFHIRWIRTIFSQPRSERRLWADPVAEPPSASHAGMTILQPAKEGERGQEPYKGARNRCSAFFGK